MWPPLGALLLANVDVEVAREAQHAAEDVIRDVVVEQPAHIGELERVRDEFREDVVFQARGRRLHPSQFLGGRQHLGSELAEKAIGIGNLLHGVRFARAIRDPHPAAGFPHSLQARGFDLGVKYQLHRTCSLTTSPSMTTPMQCVVYSNGSPS